MGAPFRSLYLHLNPSASVQIFPSDPGFFLTGSEVQHYPIPLDGLYQTRRNMDRFHLT